MRGRIFISIAEKSSSQSLIEHFWKKNFHVSHFSLYLDRQTLEKVREERDQYRWSLKEENHKVELMSQEIEEHHTQVEEANKHKAG